MQLYASAVSEPHTGTRLSLLRDNLRLFIYIIFYKNAFIFNTPNTFHTVFIILSLTFST